MKDLSLCFQWVRQRALSAFLVIFLPFSSAFSAESGQTSMVMMPIEAEGLDERAVKVSTDLVSSYLTQVPDTSLITAADIEAMVGLEQQKSVFDCDNDISCVAEIGAALGADELIRVSMGLLGTNVILTLTRIDVRAAQVKSRATRKVINDENLYDAAIRSGVGEIFGLTLGGAPKSGGTMKAVGMTTTGLGLLTLGAGAYFALEAQSLADASKSLAPGTQDKAIQAQDYNLYGNIGLGTGAALSALGLYLWFSDSGSESSTASLLGESDTFVSFFSDDTQHGLMLGGRF